MTEWSHELKHDGGPMPVAENMFCQIIGSKGFTDTGAAKAFNWAYVEAYKISMEDYQRETNMPKWGEVNGNWLAQDKRGTWTGFYERPSPSRSVWTGAVSNAFGQGSVLGNWQDAIFRCPESADEPDQLNKHGPLDDGYVPIPEYTDDHEGDPVNHPSHYTQGGIECIDAIRAALTDEEFRGFCKGNALKYLHRERHKGGDESLEKAMWYIERAL